MSIFDSHPMGLTSPSCRGRYCNWVEASPVASPRVSPGTSTLPSNARPQFLFFTPSICGCFYYNWGYAFTNALYATLPCCQTRGCFHGTSTSSYFVRYGTFLHITKLWQIIQNSQWFQYTLYRTLKTTPWKKEEPAFPLQSGLHLCYSWYYHLSPYNSSLSPDYLTTFPAKQWIAPNSFQSLPKQLGAFTFI